MELDEFIRDRHAATLNRLPGWSWDSDEPLMVQVISTGAKVAIRDWSHARPVGLVEIVKSDEQLFKRRDADAQVHLGRHFRNQALRYARRSNVSSLIVLDVESKAVAIVQSGNIPQPILAAVFAFCNANRLKVAYDFNGTLVQESGKNNLVQLARVAARTHNPRAFLSYSWEDESHRRWVLRLAADLIRNGVQVLVDEWDLRDYSNDLHLFMESAIRSSDYVILICTPGYVRRANSRKGGVGAESTIITGEFFNPAKAGKFVPIVRKATGKPETSLPSYLKSRYAIDFTVDSAYQLKLEELLRRIFGQPRYRRPELGPMPQFASEHV